jgi:hypothetical protein
MGYKLDMVLLVVGSWISNQGEQEMGKSNPRNKGLRKGQMKRFSSTMVNSGKAANRLVIGEYTARARTLATPPKEANYSDNEEHYRERRIFELRPIDVVLNALKDLWTTDFWQGYDTFNRICLVNTVDRKLFLFFSGPRWFFVQERRIEREASKDNHMLRTYWLLRRSIIYPDRETAMRRYYTAAICWFEKRDIEKPLFRGL